MTRIPYYVEVPAGWYRIMSGSHLQSQKEADNIAVDHQERTGQSVIYVHRPAIYTTGLPFHIYAKSA